MEETVLSSVNIVIKILSLIGLGLYIVFAGIIVRQEHLMANVLEEQYEKVVRLLVYVHLLGAAGVFFLALILL